MRLLLGRAKGVDEACGEGRKLRRGRADIAAPMRLIEQIVARHRRFSGELAGQCRPRLDQLALNAVTIIIEVHERFADRRCELAGTAESAGAFSVGDRRPLGRPIPADGRFRPRCAVDVRRRGNVLAPRILVHVEDGVDPIGLGGVDGSMDAAEIVRTDLVAHRFE